MSLEAVNSNGELFVVPAAFAYTFAVMNTVQDPQNFARTLDCCTGDVFADRVVLLEIQFRAGRGAKCAALHRPYCYVMWTPGAWPGARSMHPILMSAAV